jgi:hypothetical protein
MGDAMSYEEKGTWVYLFTSAGAYAVYLAIVLGRWFVVAGAGTALCMAMARWDYFWIANVLYLGFVPWAIAGSVLKLVAYRRGL